MKLVEKVLLTAAPAQDVEAWRDERRSSRGHLFHQTESFIPPHFPRDLEGGRGVAV